ncbi:TPA: acetolactate synthase small subunit [bacterium]|nr:acetolactate synthase small subunit [bacterium]
MRHIISLLVENRFGVLARIAGLFSARGYNIDSLCVAETDDPTISRMTIVTHGDDKIIEQIEKQLNKVVDVIKVSDLTDTEHVERELVLLKVKSEKRSELMEICDIFRTRIVDVGLKSLTIEITGDEGKISALINLLKPFGILELTRTGKVGVVRGEK